MSKFAIRSSSIRWENASMADATLQSMTPLHGRARLGRSGRADGDAGVVIREIKDFDIIQVIARIGKGADVSSVLAAGVGAEIADKPRRVTGNGLAVVGTAPGQWLVVARTAGDGLINLRTSLVGCAAVSDQGAGKCLLEVSGPHARDALRKGIPVDLDPVAFKTGSSAQTAAAHIGVQISLLDDVPTFELITAASTAGSLWSWLCQSAREYGLLVT
jgi:heterotetrameric sarcosine oxidase gamma subunit